MMRKETRGIHYSLDYPQKLLNARHTLLKQPNQALRT